MCSCAVEFLFYTAKTEEMIKWKFYTSACKIYTYASFHHSVRKYTKLLVENLHSCLVEININDDYSRTCEIHQHVILHDSNFVHFGFKG